MVVQVVALLSHVRTRQGRARQVRCQYHQPFLVCVILLHQPDEARAEHGVGGREEGFLEGLERGEAFVYLWEEFGGYIGSSVGVVVDALEEEVVVEGHAGLVEAVGRHGVAGPLSDERLGILVLPYSVCAVLVSYWA